MKTGIQRLGGDFAILASDFNLTSSPCRFTLYYKYLIDEVKKHGIAEIIQGKKEHINKKTV